MIQVLLSKIPRTTECSFKLPCSADTIADLCVAIGELDDSEIVRECFAVTAKLIKDCKPSIKEEAFAKASKGLKRCVECAELDSLRAAMVFAKQKPTGIANRVEKKVDL